MIDGSSVFVIAEAGVNHNGSVEMAIQLVDAAKEAGADAVKFQTFKAENLVSKFAEKADYQQQFTDASENQFEMLKKLELSELDHQNIFNHCTTVGIRFMSSPFDHVSLDMLVNSFDLPLLKLGSGELTNAPLLLAAARSGKPIILSTGMSTLAEIEEALSVIAFGYLNSNDSPGIEAFKHAFNSENGKSLLRKNIVLLHCTTEYPSPYSEVNLRAMDTLKKTFGFPVGYSDHTDGWVIPLAAVARGARVIEKHFTMSRDLPGPDHAASLEPDELKKMVHAIRQVELSLGSREKEPTASELRNMKVARKSLVALKAIKQGESFTEENITVKRPGIGIPPIQFWVYHGEVADRSYSEDELIQ